MVAGVLLHLLAQLARGRAWHAVVRVPHPDVRCRDVLRAWVAGAGVTGVVPGRGGDVLRVLMLRPRLAGATCATVAGTLAAEAVAETACGTVVVVWAIGAGLAPAAGACDVLPVLGAVAAVIAVAAVCARRWERLRRLCSEAWQGMTAIRQPGAYVRHVLPWEVASRVVRLGSLACFLAAFDLPLSPAAVALVMAAQAGGRLVPLAPAGAGVSAAILAAGFGTVGGGPVAFGEIVAFVAGTSAVLTIVGLALSTVLVMQTVPAGALLERLAPGTRLGRATIRG
jgi:Lysylphosphatidylglycerol synthase TM region